MRFNNSSRNDISSYEEFSKFLGLNKTQNKENTTQGGQNKLSLAMVYPPKQEFIKLYDPEIALQNGTMFEELNLVFNRGSCRGTNGEGC